MHQISEWVQTHRQLIAEQKPVALSRVGLWRCSRAAVCLQANGDFVASVYTLYPGQLLWRGPSGSASRLARSR